jgi:hypothetical protein
VSVSSARYVLSLADLAFLRSYVVLVQIGLHLRDLEKELLSNPEVRELSPLA